MSPHDSSMRSWRVELLTPEPSAISRGHGPSGTSKASASECAGSVEMIERAQPGVGAAQRGRRRDGVLPTPPLPVKSRTRTTVEARPVSSSARTCRTLDLRLQLGERGLDDVRLGAALHEAGSGTISSTDSSYTTSVRAGLVGIEQVVGAVEPALDVAADELHGSRPGRRRSRSAACRWCCAPSPRRGTRRRSPDPRRRARRPWPASGHRPTRGSDSKSTSVP